MNNLISERRDVNTKREELQQFITDFEAFCEDGELNADTLRKLIRQIISRKGKQTEVVFGDDTKMEMQATKA